MSRFLSLILAIAIAPAAQGQSVPSHRIQRVPEGVEPPEIDAFLDDAAWEGASEIGALHQVEPVAGAEPSERTRVRLLFDSEHIYLAIECFDREPDKIRATQKLRDARLNPDDRVELLFDTFHDLRSGFWFQIGAGGSKGDALIDRNGSIFNKEWDGIWRGRSRINSEGWFAELRIPFATINFDPNGKTWGFNIKRSIRRRNEEVRWASPTPRISFFSIANAGVLNGFSDLRQGLGLDVAPFGVADYQRNRSTDREFTTFDFGFDAFYSITPNHKLSISVNTDFAETEVDERRVNLTRFPLFFPEKRDFFLEDAGNFSFGSTDFGGGGGRGQDVMPYFSRRIGLDADGDEVPLAASAKVTGRTDDYSFGVMDVQTEHQSDLDSKNLFVGRFSKNIFEQSDVGVILTRGNPTEDARNTTYGFDFNYRTDTFLEDRNLRFRTYFLRADTEGIDENENAYHASVSYPNDTIDLSTGVTVVEDEFDPVLGFVRRTDMKKYEARMSYAPRLYSAVRQLRFTFAPTLFETTGNQTETVDLEFTPLSVEMESGDEFSTRIERSHERLFEPFEIQEGVTIPTGSYAFTRYSVSAESSSGRPLEVEGRYTFGGFYDGKRRDFSVESTLRAISDFEFGVEYERNAVVLPEGHFTVRIWRLRGNFQFTPRLSWLNFVQYDNISDTAGLNSRLWWIIQPGSDLFLVLNQGWGYENSLDSVTPIATQLTMKVKYTLRF